MKDYKIVSRDVWFKYTVAVTANGKLEIEYGHDTKEFIISKKYGDNENMLYLTEKDAILLSKMLPKLLKTVNKKGSLPSDQVTEAKRKE